MKSILSVWLVLQKNDEEYLQQKVNALAKENLSPVFTPHLTLLGDTTTGLDSLKKIVNENFKDIKPFKIKKTNIGQSELFFKTVFIEIELNKKLRETFLKLSEKTDKRSISDFKPHISLIYKILPKKKNLKSSKA